MGAHKYNPTAIAAKNGELPPKKKSKLSKRQREALMLDKIKKMTGYDQTKAYIDNFYS